MTFQKARAQLLAGRQHTGGRLVISGRWGDSWDRRRLLFNGKIRLASGVRSLPGKRREV